MGRKRTTGCAEDHITGKGCQNCSRILKARSRSRFKTLGLTELPIPSKRKSLERSCRAFVNKHLRLGDLQPPDHCESCKISQSDVYDGNLLFWHPQPSEKQIVFWACAPCLKTIKARARTVYVSWQWPGTEATQNNRARLVKVSARPRIAKKQRREIGRADVLELLSTDDAIKESLIMAAADAKDMNARVKNAILALRKAPF